MRAQEMIKNSNTRKLRILHVLEATLGGTLRYLNDIIRASDRDDYEYGLAYATGRADPDLPAMLERAHAAGWETFRVEMVRAVSPQSDVRSTLELKKIISRWTPDVLHCHSSKAGAIGRLGRLISMSYPAVVYSPHAIAANLGRQYLVIERAFRPLTARFSAVSASERDELVALKICSGDRVNIVHPTIDTTSFNLRPQQAARLQLSLPLDADVIIGVGRLVFQKNPRLFLEVVAKVATLRPNIRAIWIGEGEMRDEMEAGVAALGLSGVMTLAGWQPDVRPYIAASDVLLSTSRYESFGYMVAEALAMGRPAVASSVTGTRDIMSGSLADWLYPLGDTERAASLIQQILADRSTASEVGASGREQMMLHFNRDAMTQALNSLYQAAVKN